jgi:type IV secretion system protein VirB1
VDHTALAAVLLACAPQVDINTARALVEVESAANPHAIGVVGGVLARQPRQRDEAVATAKALLAGGWNFSLGLAQINVHNLDRLGLDLASAFDPCANLAAMQTILGECFQRASPQGVHRPAGQQHALRKALSCYYSGNFTTGFRHGYVQRLVTSATQVARIHVTRKEAP